MTILIVISLALLRYNICMNNIPAADKRIPAYVGDILRLIENEGFQAYVASGVIGSEEQQHGWVVIRDENGKIFYSDPETEYSRIYWLKEEHDLFYKLKEDIGATTGLGYLQYLDPFEAEEKEAEERAHPSPVESSAPEETSFPEPQG